MRSFVLYRKMEKVPARMKQLGEIRILVGDSCLPTVSQVKANNGFWRKRTAKIVNSVLIVPLYLGTSLIMFGQGATFP